MQFSKASAIESVVWDMRLADYPRGLNRARIADLANGVPPYTPDEVSANNYDTNVNDLGLTKITHDARRQFANVFQVPDPLFTINLDYGPIYKKREWGTRITTELNRRIKGSKEYFEKGRSIAALLALHGPGPTMWDDRETWCGDAKGIEDILIPSGTLLDMKNLPFFGVFKKYTGMQLLKMTSGPNVDKAWNMPLVNEVIAWLDKQTQTLNSNSWPEVWSPEKMAERQKEDAGLYASDSVPTIDCYDFYFWNDDKKVSGWNRRIILDAWGSPAVSQGLATRGERQFEHGKGQFLYDPGTRKYASKISEIIHFQFADASSVAPFRYHSVRSLGFLLYAVCHLQNRLHCRFNDSVFESLLQYIRVANPDDVNRLEKVDLINKGVLPEGLSFVKPEERWKINEKMVHDAMQLNRQTMADNSSSFTQDYDFDKENAEETATRTMAKVNASAAMVGQMLNQAYEYQKFEYLEICRRFCIKNSKDADVRRFRNECFKAGVPEEALSVDRWDVQPVKVLGGGNEMLQVAMADKLMSIRPLLDPTSQKKVDKIYIAANTKDWTLAEDLVPQKPSTSDATHDAQMSVGTMLQGIPMEIKEGLNHREYIEALLSALNASVMKINSSGGVPKSDDELIGLQVLAGSTIDGQPIPGNGIQNHIDLLAQDENENQRVKEYSDALGNLMNQVKAFDQRLKEQQQAESEASQANGGVDAETQQRLAGKQLIDEAKAANLRDNNALKVAQKQISFEQKTEQQQQQHAAELEKKVIETSVNAQLAAMKHKANDAKPPTTVQGE